MSKLHPALLALILFVVSMLFFYAFIAFITLEFNFLLWTPYVRATLLYMSIIVTVFGILSTKTDV